MMNDGRIENKHKFDSVELKFHRLAQIKRCDS
jgi:hypothetical protein